MTSTNTPHNTTETILFELGRVHMAGRPVELLNSFKGVPILCRSKIESATPGGVVLIAEPPESVCLEWAEHTAILSDMLPDTVSARIKSFDILTGRVELGGLAYMSGRFGERTTVRVEPDSALKVTLEADGDKVEGELVDLSLDGASVQAALQGSEEWLKRRTSIRLTVHLPASDVTLSGSVRYVAPVGKIYRLGVGFGAEEPGRAGLLAYIHQRQDETLSEVRQLYSVSYLVKSSSEGQ